MALTTPSTVEAASLEAAKLEISQLKNQLQQTIKQKQQVLDAAEKERVSLRQENQVLEEKAEKVLEAMHKSLESKQGWIEQVAEQQIEIDALTRETQTLKVVHETQQAKLKANAVEMENMRTHIKTLEAEIENFRLQQSTVQQQVPAASVNATIDGLRFQKDQAESDVDKIMQRNKNQTNLLLRLERQLNDNKKISESQIQKLKAELVQERLKVFQLLKSASRKDGDSPRPSPYKEGQDAAQTATYNYADVSDLIEGSISAIDTRTNESRVSQARAERQNWKSNVDTSIGDVDVSIQSELGNTTNMQSQFLDTAMKRNGKKRFWENLFGMDMNYNNRSKISLYEGVSESSLENLISKEIMRAYQENAKILAEREATVAARERAQQSFEHQKAQENTGTVETAAKSDQPDTESEPSEAERTDRITNRDSVSTIDTDILLQLAAQRTAGMTLEDLDKRVQRNSNLLSSIAEIADDDEEMDSSLVRDPLDRFPSGILKRKENEIVDSTRDSIMSDITNPDFLNDL